MTSQNVDKPIQIMTDKGAWQFTDEQIRQIKNKDQNAMYKFYQDNYKIFSGMAWNFIRRQYCFKGFCIYEYDDLMQQIYVDLPYYDYSSRKSLCIGIKFGTFLCNQFGGILFKNVKSVFKTCSLYAFNKTSGDEFNIVDKYVSYIPNFDEKEELEERKQKNKAIELFLLNTIKGKKKLNNIYCRIFTDLSIKTLKGDEYERLLLC